MMATPRRAGVEAEARHGVAITLLGRREPFTNESRFIRGKENILLLSLWQWLTASRHTSGSKILERGYLKFLAPSQKTAKKV